MPRASPYGVEMVTIVAVVAEPAPVDPGPVPGGVPSAFPVGPFAVASVVDVAPPAPSVVVSAAHATDAMASTPTTSHVATTVLARTSVISASQPRVRCCNVAPTRMVPG